MYEVLWEKKAFKQLMAIEHAQRKTITHAAASTSKLARMQRC